MINHILHARTLTVVHQLCIDRNNFFGSHLVLGMYAFLEYCGFSEHKNGDSKDACVCHRNIFRCILELEWFLLTLILIQLVTYGPWKLSLCSLFLSLVISLAVIRSLSYHTFPIRRMYAMFLSICTTDIVSFACSLSNWLVDFEMGIHKANRNKIEVAVCTCVRVFFET